jgi:hypothetical protein
MAAHGIYFQKSTLNVPQADIRCEWVTLKNLWCGFGGTTPLSGVSKNMPFEIKPIDQETFDAVYTPRLTNQLSAFIHPTREWFDLSRRRWMTDEARDIYFLETSLADRMDWAFSYVLIQNGEFALVRTENHSHQQGPRNWLRQAAGAVPCKGKRHYTK